MVFPESGSPLPRHPSQLYQFGLEGLTLFAFMWWYGRKPRQLGDVAGMFMLGYGVLRFTAEYFREPDNFLGLLALNMSMGQWLCVPMILGGIAIVVAAKKDAFRPKDRKA
jgi:phosphatidylglycerol:prolipoprotein diacylglycerol transferase